MTYALPRKPGAKMMSIESSKRQCPEVDTTAGSSSVARRDKGWLDTIGRSFSPVGASVKSIGGCGVDHFFVVLFMEKTGSGPEWPLRATERLHLTRSHLESMVAELRDDAQEALGQGRPSGTARRRKN